MRENRARLTAALGRDAEGRAVRLSGPRRRGRPPRGGARPEPVHRRIRRLDSGAAGHASQIAAEADGQVTANPELTPLVQVADCLPVALAGERGVAMLHCGWRGLAAGIVERGRRARSARRRPRSARGSGRCCYEVGDEVLEAFAPLGDGIADGRMLDLPEVARRLLARAGVDEVESSGLCTSCEPELFFSHRRDAGRTGRQAGLVWVDA